jgi:zinc/manganese transport system substrate-binding protein
MMIRRAMVWMAAIVLVMGMSAPATIRGQEAAQPLNVVTTFSILDDLVKQVGGEAVVTHPLVEAGADSHTYEPAPADVVALAEADLVFEIGLGFETWLDGIYESSGSDAPRIIASENVDLLQFEDGHHDATEEEHAGEADHDDADHEHGEFDPHIWHDVTNAIIIVETVRDALIDADPTNAATYEANAAAYTAELEALDAWVQEQVSTLPVDRRKLVTSHEAVEYLADRYGFEVIGTAFGSLSTETGDPSAADIAALIGHIQDQQVPAIFAENVENPDLMESIAAEAGVTVAPPLYTDALGTPGSGAETYIDLMRTNVDIIVTALSQ